MQQLPGGSEERKLEDPREIWTETLKFETRDQEHQERRS